MEVRQWYGGRMKDKGLGLHRVLFDIRIDRRPNEWARETCGLKEEVDERIDEGALW